jgi:ribonuclease HI
MTLTIYTDASTGRSGRTQLLGLGAVILRDGEPWRELRKAVKATRQMSTLGEVLAIEMALQRFTPEVRAQISVRVFTDFDAIPKLLKRADQLGKHRFAYVRVQKLLAECQAWECEWIRGHSGNRHNERADQLARRAIVEAA